MSCETGFLHAEESSCRHGKRCRQMAPQDDYATASAPRNLDRDPGDRHTWGITILKGCCSSLLRFLPAATTDEMRDKRLESLERCLLVWLMGVRHAQQKPRAQEDNPLAGVS